ncbi:hypothetical protein V8G54_000774 [Vigna mungo]|uniref:Uncharacterized protein n=1 Tax=Vigna mungo TaxID=3915 RepID=A0AAQ3P5W7_VIGMU
MEAALPLLPWWLDSKYKVVSCRMATTFRIFCLQGSPLLCKCEAIDEGAEDEPRFLAILGLVAVTMLQGRRCLPDDGDDSRWKNGFTMEEDLNAKLRCHFKLKFVPFGKNTMFGIERKWKQSNKGIYGQ